MMQNCPKCGFSQPQDRYCANCGLDIESYKPAPESFAHKLQKNTRLHIALVIMIIFLVTAYIYNLEKDKILAHIKNSPMLTNHSSPKEQDHREIDDTENVEVPVTSNKALAANDIKPTAMSSTEKAVAERKELVITFVELPVSLLNELTQEGQVISETALRRAVLLNNFAGIDKIHEHNAEVEILSGGTSFNFKSQPQTSFDFTHISGPQNDDIGLNLNINVDQANEQNIELSTTGSINLIDEAGQPLPSVDLSAKYAFHPASTLLLIGLLPRQVIKSEDIPLFTNTPLTVFESQAYLSGASEFVIFIHAQ